MIRTLLLLAFSFALSASAALKIGVVAPLTGDRAEFGIALRNAVILASEDNPDFDVEIIIEDTHSQLSGIALAAKKLISVDKVDVIFTPYSTQVAIIGPMATKAGILLLTCAWNAGQIKAQPYTFSNSVSVNVYSDVTAELCNRLGSQKVAVIYHNTPGWPEAVEAIEKRYGELGIEVADSLKFSPDLRDFRTPVLRMQQKGVDTVVLYLYHPASDIIIRQLQQLAPEIKVTGYLDIVQERSLLEGITYISEYKPLPEFYERYRTRFDHNAEQTLAANAYDLFGILQMVAGKLPEWDVDAAAAAFRNVTDYPGIIGDLTCGPEDIFMAPTHVVKVVGGEKVYEDL